MFIYRRYLAVVLALLLVACGEQADRRARFVDVAADSGIDFRHTSGASGDYFLFETMGAGAAFFDYNNDGFLDVYLVDGFDLSPWQQQFAPVNLLAADSAGFWVAEEYKPPLRFAGSVDSAVFLLRQGADTEGTHNRLYCNTEASFRDVSAEVGAADRGYGMGCAVGDYDNDGYADLYVTNFGANALYHNEGGEKLLDVSAVAAVADDHWSTSAAYFDYDNDGDLDLYVANYLDMSPATNRICGGAVASTKSAVGKALRIPVDQRTYCAPRRYNGAPDMLYRNEGDGRFSDVARASNIFSAYGKGLGVVAADFDGDGDQDLYVANDGMRNFFYQNEGDGTFSEVALEVGMAYNGDGQAEAGMGIAVADYDADSDLDVLVTNFSRESNTLYRNEGGAEFGDYSKAAGLEQISLEPLGFGAFFFDAENDADLDLFVANGHVLDRIALQDGGLRYEQPNQLLGNDGGIFVDISATSGPAFQLAAVSRGAAFGDYDNDGDEDVLVSNGNGQARLYRNDLLPGNHWLALDLVGMRTNRDAVGARARLSCGGKQQTRYRLGGGSYLSASDSRMHFGLGACAVVDYLEILWPDGSRQELRDLQADQLLHIEQE